MLRSLPLLNFVILTSVLLSPLFLASASHAQSVVNDDPQRLSISLRKDQVDEARKIMNKSNVMNFRAQKTKTVTDEDIAWIASVVLKRETPPVVKAECLKPLGFLAPNKMAPGQSQKIGRIISPLLSENDEKTDPAGIVKVYALVTVSHILPPKDFAADIKRLSRDKRDNVRVTAESLLSKLR